MSILRNYVGLKGSGTADFIRILVYYVEVYEENCIKSPHEVDSAVIKMNATQISLLNRVDCTDLIQANV